MNQVQLVRRLMALEESVAEHEKLLGVLRDLLNELDIPKDLANRIAALEDKARQADDRMKNGRR